MKLLRVFFAMPILVSLAHCQLKGFQQNGNQWTFSEGAWSIHGFLEKPSGNGPFPGILVSYGRGGSAEAFNRLFGSDLTAKGLVVITVDYTHAGAGEGESSGYGSSPENIKRAKKCLEILRSLKYVDGKRLAAFGHSMGAFLTIGLAAEPDSGLKAAVASAGGVVPQAGYAAPTEDVARKIKVPMLILHGDKDTTVPPERSATLQQILDAQKTPCERHLYAGRGHDIVRIEHADEVERIAAWLRRFGVLMRDS